MAKAAVAEKSPSVSVPQKTLAEMAAHVAKYAANIPFILTHVFIEQRDERLYLTCCDGETWVRRDCEAAGEDFVACVSAQGFAKCVAALPLGDIRVNASEKSIEVSSGKAKYTLPAIDAVDFPVLPDAPDDFIEIDPKWAKAVASITGPCFTEEAKARICLVGVNLRDRVASTNTHVAHSIQGFPEFPLGDVTLHAKYASMLPQCSFMACTKDRVFLKADGLYVVGAAMQAAYLDVDRVFPNESTRYATLEADVVADALKRAARVADLRVGWVRLTFTDNSVDIESYTHDMTQTFKETIPCVGLNIDGFTVALNYKYLLECIEIADEPSVKLDFTESMRPFLIHGEGDYLGVILPRALA